MTLKECSMLRSGDGDGGRVTPCLCPHVQAMGFKVLVSLDTRVAQRHLIAT
jgi:hypothetical protein